MKDFDRIVNNPLLIRVLKKGSKVIRVRLHNKENDLFRHKSEVSYAPAKNTSLMRANFKNEPMFYGAIFSESLKDDGVPRLTCLLETHKGVSDDNYIGIRDLTYSAWRNKRDINLFVIPIFDSYENPPVDFVWYFEMWKHLIQEYNLNDDDIILLTELSQKFAFVPTNPDEEKECYSYTAEFTKKLLDSFPQIDGVMYPSSKLGKDGMGINVAIRPSVIDEDFELIGCSLCRFFKRSKSQQLVLTYKRGKVQSNDAISYNLDKEYYRDLDLVNQKDPSFEIKKMEFNY